MPKINIIATQHSVDESNITGQCVASRASKADDDYGSCMHSRTSFLLRKLSAVFVVL